MRDRGFRRRAAWGVAAAVAAGSVWAGIAGADPAPALAPGGAWLNTDRPLRLDEELAGHVVLLDFWTHCCINCLHVLPELAYLEEKYAEEPFAVVGVHSAKFDDEGTRRSVRQAIERYGIEHPVVLDRGMEIWKRYEVRSWPTFILIGAGGEVIGRTSGEGQLPLLDVLIREALDEAREAGTLAGSRVEIRAGEVLAPVSGLRFPGKVEVAPAWGGDGPGLLIADSGHDRVVETTWPDAQGRCRAVRVYGGGAAGFASGAAGEAAFDDPQGMCAGERGRVVYVADRGNHAIRALDRGTGWVSTIAGTGERGRDKSGGGVGVMQSMASAWDVALGPGGERILIAMAGTHQLWELRLEGLEARAIAGSGRENSVDGWASDAALAQPSGVAVGGEGRRVYFADSESSSVRMLDLERNEVETIVGHAVESELENGLFEFGDVDGTFPEARLQHPLGVAVWGSAEGERVLVADTYNDKIRLVFPEEKRVETWFGGEVGGGVLDEPGGVAFGRDGDGRGWVFVADTNNHRIVMIDAATREWREVMISGLDGASDDGPAPKMVVVEAEEGEALAITAGFELGAGRKASAEMPASIRVTALEPTGRRVLAQRTVRTERSRLAVEVPGEAVRGGARWLVEVSLAWCDGDEGVCVPVEARWIALVEPAEDVRAVTLTERVE